MNPSPAEIRLLSHVCPWKVGLCYGESSGFILERLLFPSLCQRQEGTFWLFSENLVTSWRWSLWTCGVPEVFVFRTNLHASSATQQNGDGHVSSHLHVQAGLLQKVGSSLYKPVTCLYGLQGGHLSGHLSSLIGLGESLVFSLFSFLLVGSLGARIPASERNDVRIPKNKLVTAGKMKISLVFTSSFHLEGSTEKLLCVLKSMDEDVQCGNAYNNKIHPPKCHVTISIHMNNSCPTYNSGEPHPGANE